MQYEVGQKFPVADIEAFEGRLRDLGARFGDPIEQVDRYFSHPARHFAVTDEALRIRRMGSENFITYKGPKLDANTKTRREIELPLAAGVEHVEQFSELLKSLGFGIVAEVRKRRRTAEFTWNGGTVTAALDDVAEVGVFAELEILANEAELDAARGRLLALAAELGLATTERRSYLELLLLARAG